MYRESSVRGIIRVEKEGLHQVFVVGSYGVGLSYGIG